MGPHTEGVRRLTPGAVGARRRAQQTDVGKIARKELAGIGREACEALMLRPALRQVLGELVACYGEQQIARGLMVWPSNVYLGRKTGLAERTIRKCVRELAQLELILPVDSANRKRFAIRSKSGDILDAFGFDLRPLYARRLEFAALLIQQREARAALNRSYDELTIARKATEEALRALSEHFPGADVEALTGRFTGLCDVTPRRGVIAALEPLLVTWRSLRAAAEDLFYEHSTKNKKETGDAGTGRRHQETNNGWSSDPCKSSDEKGADFPSVTMIVEACPAAAAFGETMLSDLDVIRVGRYLRGTIGAHPSAWDEASSAVGPMRAAIIVLIVLQLVEDDLTGGGHRIKNPGGLFRDMVRRCAAGQLNLFVELSALRRRHMG